MNLDLQLSVVKSQFIEAKTNPRRLNTNPLGEGTSPLRLGTY